MSGDRPSKILQFETNRFDPYGAHGAKLERIKSDRLAAAKRAFVTRRVPASRFRYLLHDGRAPAAGDLVLARVQRLGQHTGVQRTDGRRAKIFPGDEIIVAYGSRYAPNQFESRLPDDLGDCHLVAAGGMASRVLTRNQRIKRATEIKPLGLLADGDKRIINLRDHTLPEIPTGDITVPIIAVAGTTMDAGKTTAAADLIVGLRRAGMRVGAAKLTGTGACGDYYFFLDAGAEMVLDFTDAGYSSTCGLSVKELESIFLRLVNFLNRQVPDAIVLEIADGLLQEETAGLLRSAAFGNIVNNMIFCAPDSMGAISGVEWLEQNGLPVSAVAGALSGSPLAAREASREIHLPILNRADLANPQVAVQLLESPTLAEFPETTHRGGLAE